MAKKIKANEMDRAIADILADYSGATYEAMKIAVDESRKEIVDLLKRTSPKLTGDYAKSWASRVEDKTGTSYTSRVYNKEHYRLTHLLEFPHLKRNGERWEPTTTQHITKAAEEAERIFWLKLKGKL